MKITLKSNHNNNFKHYQINLYLFMAYFFVHFF